MVQTRSVKRRRAGRKRQAGGEYTKAGRLKVSPESERGWANMNLVLARRCVRRGLRVTDDNLRAMRDQREGYVLGKLLNDKAITEAQHDAGLKYAGVYRAWAKSAGMPRVTAPAGSYGLTVAGRSEVPDEMAEATQKAYFAAAEALIAAGMLAEWWVKRVTLEDNDAQNMSALTAGLDELVKHFG